MYQYQSMIKKKKKKTDSNCVPFETMLGFLIAQWTIVSLHQRLQRWTTQTYVTFSLSASNPLALKPKAARS